MHKDFWLSKWNKLEIGFHLNEVNPVLLEHGEKLELSATDYVFVPLCGKSKDMLYLSEHSNVIGVELSEKAIKQFFEENNISFQVNEYEEFKCFDAKNIKIYQGDLFNLPQDVKSMINKVYDRASLVALPLDMRMRYYELMNSLDVSKYLLTTLEYDQSLFKGPPFRISEEEVHSSLNFQFIKKVRSQEDNGFSMPVIENTYIAY